MTKNEMCCAAAREGQGPALRAGKLLSRATLVAALALSLAPSRADALERREVEAVVTILERLSAATGKTVFFDEEAAREWFEIDEGTSRLIPASGFTGASWKDAFDQTMAGFISAIPPAELEAMVDDFAAKLDEARKMTPGQRQVVKELLHEQMRGQQEIRDNGMPYRGVVSPYFARIKSISLKK